MIAGTGLDLVEIDRIRKIYQKYGMRFTGKILTPAEAANMPAQAGAFLAGRFAAKEAAVKALGCGFAHGILPTNIEVLNAPGGQPVMTLHARALSLANELHISRIYVSISHERSCAAALVIMEG